jgi:hypothetical protein
MEVAFWLLLSLGIASFFWLCWRNIQRSRHERINSFLTAVLTIAALMTGQQAMATTKTVTYTFTAVNGSGDAKTLTFTPSGARFGTASGAKTVTIPSTSSTTGFTVELDDGVILTFSRNSGHMTFSSSNGTKDGIMLNYSGNNNSRFTVACTDYYIRHVKFADKSGNAFYGTGTPAPTSNALLDVDVNIDKASSKDDHSNCYQVNSVSGSPTFGSITITLADFASGSGTKNAPYTIRYTSDLDHLATFVNNGQDYSGVYFVLSNDIAYSHSSDWNYPDSENNYTAIGTFEHPFKGTFDGQGYTISGIRIYKKYTTSNKSYMDQGLFGYVGEGGTVKRVNLADARITAYTSGGGIAGRVYKSTIEDCSVGNNVWIHAVEKDADSQGGIVGCSQSGTVCRCISRATLAINSDLTGCHYFGGIVGNNNNTITDCIATGVIIPNVNGRGAIAGYNYDANDLTRNYYRGCKVASNNVTPTGVGVGKSKYNTDTYDVSNKQGARALYAITLGTDVTLDRTVKATLPNTNNKTNKTYANGADIEDQPYAYATATVSLGYSGVTSSGCEVVYSTTGGTVDGNTLTMPTSDVTVTATVAYRLYENLGITNAIATEIAGKPAIFSRTFSKDVASTICLPFSMTSITGGTVYEFVGIEYDNTINAWVATMSNATPGGNNVTATEANKPYLFLPSADGEVTFMGTAASPIAANSTTSGDWTFHGTFQRLTYGTDPMTGYVYGLASTAATVEGQAVQAGEFVHAIDGAGVPPFRCYLTYNNNGGQFAGTRSGGEAPSRIIVRLIGGDGETTRIMSIDNGEWTIDNSWYSLDGRRLNGRPTAKGLYIHNGRKEVLK